MAESSVALVLQDRTGALGLITSSAGVHLGESDDLLQVEVTAEDAVAGESIGTSAADLAVARALATKGLSVASIELRDVTSSAAAFAGRLRDAGVPLGLPEGRALGTVRGRGDVLSGEASIRGYVLDEPLAGLRYEARASIVDAWTKGARLPSLALAHVLSLGDDLRDHGLVIEDWEVAPGLRMMPVATPTIFPATHTNSFLVGTGHLLIVEPASPFPEEIERMALRIESLVHEGFVVDGLVLTHHHPDHVGGAMALRERLGVPVIAHERTAQRLEGEVVIDRRVGDGDRLTIDGPTRMELELLHTPGHAPGHLCLFERRSGALIAGDMVAGVGTILVEPYDGDMQLYLDSLARLRDLGSTMVLPAHGGVVRDPKSWLSYYMAHRLAREAKIVAALAEIDQPATVDELVPIAYADTSPTAWPLARMASTAHLDKLVREGRVATESGRFRLVRPTSTAS